MKEFLTSVVLASVVLYGSVAHAGGPVVVEEGNNEAIEEKTVRSAGILPVLGALILVCLLACGGDDDETTPVVEPK